MVPISKARLPCQVPDRRDPTRVPALMSRPPIGQDRNPRDQTQRRVNQVKVKEMARIDSPQGDRFPAPDSSGQSADPPAGLEAENRTSQGPIQCRDEVPDPASSGAG